MERMAMASSITTGSLLHRADAQDRHLRLIDDGRREHAAEAAEIGDGERSALHFVGLELARAGARRPDRRWSAAGPATFFSSALRITGTIRPFSSATAMPMLISL